MTKELCISVTDGVIFRMEFYYFISDSISFYSSYWYIIGIQGRVKFPSILSYHVFTHLLEYLFYLGLEVFN